MVGAGPLGDPHVIERLENDKIIWLSTVRPDGRPHLVPCCFALDGDVAYSVVDHKPKRSTALRRLEWAGLVSGSVSLASTPSAALTASVVSSSVE